MRKTVQTALLTTFLALAANAQADLSDVPSGEYGLDDHHAYISFTYSHIGYSTPHIGFRNFDANLMLDSENPQNSEIEVVIDTTSIDSRVDEFNGHLRSANFFDTENFLAKVLSCPCYTIGSEDSFSLVSFKQSMCLER